MRKKCQETGLLGHLNSVNSLALTGDQKFIVSGSEDNTISVWEFQEKTFEAVLQGHTSGKYCSNYQWQQICYF